MKVHRHFMSSKKALIVVSIISALVGASQGAIIEFWDFENHPEGAEAVGPAGVSGINGTNIKGWSDGAGPQWETETPTNGGFYSIGATNQDGFLDTGNPANTTFNNFSSADWTLEMSVNFSELDGWETMFARMGSNTGLAESDLYFQRMGDGSGSFRLSYSPEGTTAFADRVNVQSSTVIETGTWYGFAATADSSTGTVSLYVDSGNGYVLEDQVTGLSNTAFQENDNNSHYAFFRDYFNNGQGNFSTAFIDNVRLSDTALSASDLIPVSAVQVSAIPEPSGVLALGLLFGASMLTRRR